MGLIEGIVNTALNEQDEPEESHAVNNPSLDPFANQLVGQNSFDQSLALGFLDEESLRLSSPIQRAMGEAQRRGMFAVDQDSQEQIGRVVKMAERALNRGIPTNSREFRDLVLGSFSDETKGRAALRMFENIVEVSGHGSFERLFKADHDYMESAQGRMDQARGTADNIFGSRLQARDDIAALLGNLPTFGEEEFGAFKEGELNRLTRDIDKRGGDLLRQSNILGINPGRAMGDLEFLRQDADLEATNRALALIGGQQSIAGNSLSLLQAGLGESTPLNMSSPGGGASSSRGLVSGVNAKGAAAGASLAGQEEGAAEFASSFFGPGIG